MSKIRVYELAKELNISSKKLIEMLMEEFNVEVKNHMSVIEDEDAELIKEFLTGVDTEELKDDNDDKKKSIVDEYEDILSEEVNKGNKKRYFMNPEDFTLSQSGNCRLAEDLQILSIFQNLNTGKIIRRWLLN